jgi:hypothetical protein
MNLRSIGYIRVISGILDNKAGAAAASKDLAVQAESGRLTCWQDYLCSLDDPLLPQHQRRPSGSSRSAGSGRVSMP